MISYEITFTLEALTPAEYSALTEQLAPEIARMPGLVQKIWITDPATGRYGGIYLWRDRESLDAFRGGPFDAAANPAAFGNVRTRVLDVLDTPTAVTAPVPVHG